MSTANQIFLLYLQFDLILLVSSCCCWFIINNLTLIDDINNGIRHFILFKINGWRLAHFLLYTYAYRNWDGRWQSGINDDNKDDEKEIMTSFKNKNGY